MFYLNVNILLIILSNHCLIGFTHDVNKYQSEISSESAKDYCTLWVPGLDYNMPIPFSSNRAKPEIFQQDNNGNIFVKINTTIKLSCCIGEFFMPPVNCNYSEIIVKCVNTSFLEYRGAIHRFEDYRCTGVPKPTMKITKNKCQNENGVVLEMGCSTKSTFLLFYKICFDMVYKNTLFTWYIVQSPYFMRRQMAVDRPHFKRTALFTGDINRMYKDQNDTLEKILGSKKMILKYINHPEEFVTRGHLTARTEFNYVFQQVATFFYENTAPQWYSFNKGIWRFVEKAIRKTVSGGNIRHLIVSGTYGNCTLRNKDGVPKTLFLLLPHKIKVPQYIWKMDYDIYNETGMVYVGMNNPYKKIDSSMYICTPIPCPDSLDRKQMINHALLFCCSKKSFESAYGKLDNIVFRQLR